MIAFLFLKEIIFEARRTDAKYPRAVHEDQGFKNRFSVLTTKRGLFEAVFRTVLLGFLPIEDHPLLGHYEVL
jgi:hypothetical protein